MIWNWQHKDWSNFKYDQKNISDLEKRFINNSGVLLGAAKYLSKSDKDNLVVMLASDEALNSSEIEGEYLNRDSLQSSIKLYFNIAKDNRKASSAENGISELLADMYYSYDQPLSHDCLFRWHEMLMNGRKDLDAIGKYRTHLEPMQVISGKYHEPIVHFEAPPSDIVPKEMDRFIEWYNNITDSITPLTKAAIAHLYFESIHPFEDGNGRIGRVITIKMLCQNIKQPILIALSHVINQEKKLYYNALENNNKSLEITDWILYFVKTIIKAQVYTLLNIEFLINKTKFYDKFKNALNTRQEKVIKRIFEEGVEGFKGGLSAKNYLNITKTSKATATRDLQELVEMQAFIKTGDLKSTRYYINLEN
ncbi:Fic family protein [Rickettsia endosymbiont of Gonocerus acuteangulatus]|uniref:Fic family protein n=1 Tax=Rickettsia endosymbiont of Gonocerus acuteangulatus TaxID=3066266 RepID=UPI0031334F2E